MGKDGNVRKLSECLMGFAHLCRCLEGGTVASQKWTARPWEWSSEPQLMKTNWWRVGQWVIRFSINGKTGNQLAVRTFAVSCDFTKDDFNLFIWFPDVQIDCLILKILTELAAWRCKNATASLDHESVDSPRNHCSYFSPPKNAHIGVFINWGYPKNTLVDIEQSQ